MYSFNTTNNGMIQVYFNNRLKFVSFDLSKALQFITIHNARGI